MKKMITINIIILVILILTILLILHVFNMKYHGVPIYEKLGVTLEDLKSYKHQKKIKHVELDYINYFSKYTAEEYLDNYKTHIEKFNNFINTNCSCKENLDIKNVVVNLNTQYKKFLVDYEGLNSLFIEILRSHNSISNRFFLKLSYATKLLQDINSI